jgi:hypothetical protein
MATVVAYGTNKQAYFDLFMASCRRHGISPVLLGWGKKWVGFGNKTSEIRDCIRTLPDDEIVISVDPFDVVFLCGLDEIESKFRHASAPFLCGALRLGPFLRWVYEREFNRARVPVPHNPTGYDYLNSGTWVSTAGYARQLIGRLESEFAMGPTDMDQEILTGIYARHRATVDIDWRCEIFHNLLFKNFASRSADLKDLDFADGRIRNTATGSRPCILHASGNARMEGIARRLGFAAEDAKPTENTKNYFKKAIFHILMLLRARSAPQRLAGASGGGPRTLRASSSKTIREPADGDRGGIADRQADVDA